MDYLSGEPDSRGQGVGTAMICSFVTERRSGNFYRRLGVLGGCQPGVDSCLDGGVAGETALAE